MTEYKDNETYERDKAEMIYNLTLHFKNEWSLAGIDIPDVLNLLRQSKWSGIDDSERVRPMPVVKDKYGKLTKNYDQRDWIIALNEEYKEAIEQIILEDTTRTAEELQDLITVCTSYLEYLGFDEAARLKLTKQVNEKNRKRGYLQNN